MLTRRDRDVRSATRAAVWMLVLLTTAACISSAPRRRNVPADHTGPFVTWWADGVVKEEGTYREGKRHGDITSYHPDGSLAYEGAFEDGVPVGAVTRYHPGGELAVTEFVRDGALHGPREEYDEWGTLVASVTYEEGRKHGEETRWSGDVQVMVGHWEQGLPVGHWSYWHPDGSLDREERYWISDGLPAGYMETVYSEEAKASTQTLMTQKDGVWRGWTTFWHDNGRQAALVEYVDGQRHGRDVSWDRDGHKVIEGQHRADERVGVWTYWRGADRVAEHVDYDADPETPEPGSTDSEVGEPPETG